MRRGQREGKHGMMIKTRERSMIPIGSVSEQSDV